jgi:hypothetical protein
MRKQGDEISDEIHLFDLVISGITGDTQYLVQLIVRHAAPDRSGSDGRR